ALFNREIRGQPLLSLDDGYVVFGLVAAEVMTGDHQAGEPGAGHGAGTAAAGIAPTAVGVLRLAEMRFHTLPDLAGNLDAGVYGRVQPQDGELRTGVVPAIARRGDQAAADDLRRIGGRREQRSGLFDVADAGHAIAVPPDFALLIPALVLHQPATAFQ